MGRYDQLCVSFVYFRIMEKADKIPHKKRMQAGVKFIDADRLTGFKGTLQNRTEQEYITGALGFLVQRKNINLFFAILPNTVNC